MCDKGTRIIIGWDPNVVNVMVVALTDQVMHCLLRTVQNDKRMFASFVYASNSYIKRRKLWSDLCMHKGFVGNHPWTILGDFNASLFVDESTSGSSRMTIAMREFKECLDEIQVTDLNYSGINFTWNQSPLENHGMLKKIDRVLVNEAFLTEYPNAYTIFQPYRISDHSPAVLKVPSIVSTRPKMFRFSNYIAENEKFRDCVADVWKEQIEGHVMYTIVRRLRLLKKPLRKLMWQKGNLHNNVIRLRDKLDNLQLQLDANPSSEEIRDAEIKTLKEYNDAIWDEERFLKQKSKVEWLQVGDSNSKYFHKVVKAKANRCRINAVTNNEGILVEGAAVPEVFIQHYSSFLGTSANGSPSHVDTGLFTSKLPQQMALDMVRPVTDAEIKEAMFGIGDDKA
ncbi:uncharacterized protein [Rutidosis leptorrhynchoides]|uniref:uncharacterized protein n=1 Tax=Rutidosis leptorrhynchoides TaxID=125765 RepID=UPI003A98ED98